MSIARRSSTSIDLTEHAAGLLQFAAISAVTFVCGVRAAVYFYQTGSGPWMAMAKASLVAAVCIAIAASALSFRLTGRARVIAVTKWVALPIVGVWTLYTLFYLAAANAKTPDVRHEFVQVHPVLRTAISTLLLIDRDAVITDLSRESGDYAKMGLPVFDRTLHYKQPDGWSHAVDIRTIGRGAIHNGAVQLYFKAMGFRTLRHVGTADHLHVELPNRL